MNVLKFTSILKQLSVLFIVGLLLTGWITYSSQLFRTEAAVKDQQEDIAEDIAMEIRVALSEYASPIWLINYWYEHSDEMDIEYDSLYNGAVKADAKAEIFSSRHPGIQLESFTEKDLEAMSEEDRKLYAEITYSWILDRMNETKFIHSVDYLFMVLTEEPYEEQFFIMSAADPGSVRGTNYEEVYPLGVEVTVNDSQKRAMAHAVEFMSHLADAGSYVDYYSYFDSIGDKDILFGMTYDLSHIQTAIRDRTREETFAAVLGQAILSAICMMMVYALLIKPLKKVQENIRIYRETKESGTVVPKLREINSRNEIGELTNDIIELTEDMDNYVDEIEAITSERQRIESELDMAKRIQMAMMPGKFPPFPDRHEFNIYASVDPAREVGGDFYDFYFVDEDHLCLVIADVSGKGIPAALFMMGSKIVVKNCAMLGKSAAEILERTNRGLCENNEQDMFLTAWVGILELSTGRLVASNAGHEYPALMRADGKFEIIKGRHGFVLGGMEDVTYKEYELQLEPGDKLFLYTDGLPEATDCDGNMFGTDRMLDALNRDPAGDSESVIKGVRKAVDGFVRDAEQFDDLTMMCLEYKGPEDQKA